MVITATVALKKTGLMGSPLGKVVAMREEPGRQVEISPAHLIRSLKDTITTIWLVV